MVATELWEGDLIERPRPPCLPESPRTGRRNIAPRSDARRTSLSLG